MIFTRFKLVLRSKYLFYFKRRFHKGYPELDLQYLCDPKNSVEISENIKIRKGVGNIGLVQQLYNELKDNELNLSNWDDVQSNFYDEAKKIPNGTHPDVVSYGNEPKVLKYVGIEPKFDFEPREFHDICKKLNLIRTEQLGNVAGSRSYFFLGILSELEQALIRYSVSKLVKMGFQILSVPDILHSGVIESCGMNVKGERTQIYNLDPDLHGPDLCLSGTSEMAIAGYFANKTIPVEDLPLKIAAVSRCYRAETSSTAEERGIYRVHQFTKVEMFALSTPEDSDTVLESFKDFQEEHFESLGLYFQVLDMPPHELGAPAYRKYDLEAFLPGRKMFGEVSSCSNCTDFQSRRLGIKYKLSNGNFDFVHTINGTACAIPRMLIALIETFQTNRGVVKVPEVLIPFLRNQNEISKQKCIPELKLKKIKRYFCFYLN